MQAVAVGVSMALVMASGVAALELRHALLKGRVLATRLDRARRDVATAQPPLEPPPDIVQRLPAAPSVDQLMNVLQHVAGEQGVRVEALQSDDHVATPSELGRLGVAVTLRAPYPAIVHVVQALLDRYPGATLRRLELVRAQAAGATVPAGVMGAMGAAPMPGASAPAVEVEAHLTLDMWSRAVGVVPVPSAQEESPPAPAASEASAAPGVRAVSGVPAVSAASAARSAGAASAPPGVGVAKRVAG